MSKKITDLTLLASADSTDIVPLVDISASTAKKTTVGGLAAAVGANIPATTITPAMLTSAARWWEELGRTTLGSAADTISITSFTAKKYLRIYISAIPSGAIRMVLRFNNDSANNYSQRYSFNNGAETTGVSASGLILSPSELSMQFTAIDVVNISAQEKATSGVGFTTGTPGAGNTATSFNGFGKWANTSAQITRVDVVNDQAGDFATGSELIVLGHD